MAKLASLTPARITALELAENDRVLLVRKRGGYGSIDTRDEVRPSTALWLCINGYLKLTVAHGDNAANGFELTDKGRAYLQERHPHD